MSLFGVCLQCLDVRLPKALLKRVRLELRKDTWVVLPKLEGLELRMITPRAATVAHIARALAVLISGYELRFRPIDLGLDIS
jgi:hypothetical protein